MSWHGTHQTAEQFAKSVHCTQCTLFYLLFNSCKKSSMSYCRSLLRLESVSEIARGAGSGIRNPALLSTGSCIEQKVHGLFEDKDDKESKTEGCYVIQLCEPAERCANLSQTVRKSGRLFRPTLGKRGCTALLLPFCRSGTIPAAPPRTGAVIDGNT